MLAVTNGASIVDLFPFSNEIDSNALKTASGRLSYTLPIGAGLEVGASGAIGAQDYQPDNSVLQWHYGFDAKVELGDLLLSGEWVTGRALGARDGPLPPCFGAPCLAYRGGYVLTGYRLTNVFTPYARVDWRDAFHQQGASFFYLSKVIRLTAGIKAELNPSVLLKAEYVLNREMDPLPQFEDDVFTSSLVIKY
jgi:hypothetical protein